MAQRSYTVRGMTCEHCARSVTEEVGRIEGVQRVEVDLVSGRVTVTSQEPVPMQDVRMAVTEAGYELEAR